MKLTGTVCEVGTLESGTGRGCCIKNSTGTVEITGMTEDECRTAAQWYGEIVTVAIQPINAELSGPQRP